MRRLVSVADYVVKNSAADSKTFMSYSPGMFLYVVAEMRSDSPAMMRPSPCEIGTEKTSPSLTLDSHGESLLTTQTREMRDW